MYTCFREDTFPSDNVNQGGFAFARLYAEFSWNFSHPQRFALRPSSKKLRSRSGSHLTYTSVALVSLCPEDNELGSGLWDLIQASDKDV